MEMTCSRCHQTVQAETSFCSHCGLPQLVYSTEATPDGGQPTRWNDAVRDASAVAWRPALHSALILAIPTGVLCAFLAPAGIFGLLLMGATGAWAVSLYMRSQRPAWITIGAGARIGLVTGILGSWTTAATTGITLYALRYWFRQGRVFDDLWQNIVKQQLPQQWAEMGADAGTIAQAQALLLAPDGRVAAVLFTMAFLTVVLLVCAIAGGALGARMHVRRRPEV